jgi:hypothetical protein
MVAAQQVPSPEKRHRSPAKQQTPRETGYVSLETKASALYMSTRGMAVGSSLNYLMSSLVAKTNKLGTLSLFLISLMIVTLSRGGGCSRFTSVF